MLVVLPYHHHLLQLLQPFSLVPELQTKIIVSGFVKFHISQILQFYKVIQDFEHILLFLQHYMHL